MALTHPRTAWQDMMNALDSASLAVEYCMVAQANGRVLACDHYALVDNPPQAVSAMDGYAVLADDDYGVGSRFKIMGESRAGCPFERTEPIKKGQAVRIFTGALVPMGANSIIIQEDTETDGADIKLTTNFQAFRYIRPKSMNFAKAQSKIDALSLLDARHIGILASFGYESVALLAKPRVLIITSGDELVLPCANPPMDKIIASNQLSLKALVESWGAIATVHPILPDNQAMIADAIAQSHEYDFIITIGGASVGDYDFIVPALRQLSAQIIVLKMALRPGKPIIFAKLGHQPILCLSGNSVSSHLGAMMFVRPIINHFLKQPAHYIEDIAINAILTHDIAKNDLRMELMRAHYADGQVTALERQDSSLHFDLIRANCLLIRPAYTALSKGERVKVVFLHG